MSDSKKPVVFVLGANGGNIGPPTLAALSAKYADRVEIRAGTRNPASAERLKNLPNVSIVAAAMADRENLPSTLSGVDALFIVTPCICNRAEVVVTTAEIARDAGVRFIMLVSVLTADLADTVFGAQFKKIEEDISRIGVPYCFLRLPYFVENHLILNKENMKLESTFRCPVDPDKPYTPVTTSDCGNAAAAILADSSRHGNKTYKIISHRSTFGEVTEAIGEALGREIRYVRVTYETGKAMLVVSYKEEWKADGITELYRLIDDGSPITNEADVSDYFRITNERPTDLKTWASKVAGSLM